MPEVVDVLADAFAHEPGLGWICRGSAARRRAWFAATATMLSTVEGFEAHSDGSAAALVSPPGPGPGVAATTRWTARVAAGAGVRAVGRTLAYVRAAEAVAHRDAWTLEFLGVTPDARGTGRGAALLRRIVAAHPVLHLTTADPANVPLYEHFGFTATTRFTVGPLACHAMLRRG